MGLSEREQQALDSIEDGLAGSDPKLASLLATFTRLTAGDALPPREKIRACPGRPGARRRYHCLDLGPRRPRRPRTGLGWQLAWPLLWLVVSIALIALIAGTSGGGGGACYGWTVSACTGQAPARAAHAAVAGAARH
jgi:Protein of unknown function (DUF3040)